jgi:NAD(P)H-nitrite reductase large subunit/ferredoxin
MPQNKILEVDPEKSLLQILESNEIRIEAGCRMGVCGADPVAIVEGLENLNEPGGDERATLERLGFAANTRMACSTKVCGHIKVSLSPVRSATPVALAKIDFEPDHRVQSVVIIGNGIAGSTAADYIRRHHQDCEIHVIGNEKYPLYNRMGISRLIYGRSAMQGLYLLPDEWYEERRITTWLNTRAVSINFPAKTVLLATDQPLQYDRLILAMGSCSFIPDIKNFGVAGSFVLRNADDAMSIRAYAQQHLAQTAVVAGGGLLGLETAYALVKLGLKVTVLERGQYLLQRQLDQRAAAHLQAFLEQLGIDIKPESEVSSVQGDNRLSSVTLKSRHKLHTDMLIVAAGVRANLELVKNTAIDINRAVKVNRYMQTSLHDVYAVGDAAEPESGNVYGLWPVAVDQGRIAGINVIGGRIPYSEHAPATLLKVVGLDLLSVGLVEDRECETIMFEDNDLHRYRKLLVRNNNTVAGAILLAYPQYAQAVTQAVQTQLPLTKKQLKAVRTGNWDDLIHRS